MMLCVCVLMKTCFDSNKLAEASVHVRIWLFSDCEAAVSVTSLLGNKSALFCSRKALNCFCLVFFLIAVPLSLHFTFN